MSSSECYVYVSTRSCEDPVRTIVLCVPDASVRSVEDVQAFASASGWIDEAEFDGAVLLAPVVAGGWASAQGEPARDCFFAAAAVTVCGNYRRAFFSFGDAVRYQTVKRHYDVRLGADRPLFARVAVLLFAGNELRIRLAPGHAVKSQQGMQFASRVLLPDRVFGEGPAIHAHCRRVIVHKF